MRRPSKRQWDEEMLGGAENQVLRNELDRDMRQWFDELQSRPKAPFQPRDHIVVTTTTERFLEKVPDVPPDEKIIV